MERVVHAVAWEHNDAEVHAAAGGQVGVSGLGVRGQVDVHGKGYHGGPFRCSSSVLQPEATLMSIGRADTRGHTDVCGPHKVMLMSMAWDVSEGLAWAHDPTATKGCVHGLCCHQKPRGGL